MKSILKYSIALLCFGHVSMAQESQSNILKSFDSGKYLVYKLNEKKKFEKVKKTWPLEITKVGDDVSQVLVKRSGILDEIFIPDVPGYPAYFAYKTFRLSFTDNYAVYYEWNGKQEAKTKYILVKPGGSYSGSFESTNKSVAAYAIATFKNQTGARANANQAKTDLAEAERKANSLEEKTVLKIEIVIKAVPSKIAHFSPPIRYGVMATLQDGTQLKTNSLGGKMPWDDFKLTHEGSSNTIDEVRVDEDALNIPNDAVVLRVSSVYHPSLTASKSLNTTNNVGIKSNNNGFWGYNRHKHMSVTQGQDGQHAGRGDDLMVKVKTVKHKQTGNPINKIEIYNTTKKKLVSRYKLTPETEIIINALGGQGMKGYDGSDSRQNGGNGGSGGAGGNVIFIKDLSVVKHNIKINTNGGKGGRGGAPKYASASRGINGRNGDDGALKTESKSVVLDF